MANMTTIEILTGIKNWVLGKIGNITALIPSQASSSNQLADKAFVNSSIATATATFQGTYNVVSDLSLSYNATHAQIQTALATKMSALSIVPDNNDYAFVQIPTADATPTEIAKTEKYKYNGTAWAFEYELNSSGFTAAQWASINSGATLELIGKLQALPTNSELTTLLNGKEAVANKVTTITSESTDTQYGSAKSVYTLVMSVASAIREWANNIFAKIDGYYETMVVGAAKNLEGQNVTEESFFARPTGGEDAELANGLAQMQAVKGNSVKYNQLVPTRWNNIATNQTVPFRAGTEIIAGHKYYFKYDFIKSEGAKSMQVSVYVRQDNTSKMAFFNTTGTGVIVTSNYSGKSTGNTTTTEGNTWIYTYSQGEISYSNCIIVDLTALGIDNLTTTAQVEAWIAANWGAMKYYPYSAGAVLNVNMTGIESFKRNLLNPTTGKAYIIGAYSETYGNYYGICGTYGTLTFTDAYGNESTITPDSDGKFELDVAGELTVADAGADCAVFLWWDGTETEFSEYGSNVAKLDISHIYGKLNGVGELVRVWPTGAPGLGNLQDYLKLEDGAVVAKRVMGEVDMGSFPYNKSTGSSSGIYRFFSDSIKDNIKVPTSDNFMAIAVCGRWVTATQTDGYNGYKTDVLTVGTSGRLNVYPTASYTDGNAFRTAMSGVMLYYQLATPETYTDLVYMGSSLFEDGTPVTLPVNYEADNWGIERVLPLNTPSAMVTSAPTIESKYSLDAVEQIDTHSAEIEAIKEAYVKRSTLAQGMGDAIDNTMSQAAITEELNKLYQSLGTAEGYVRVAGSSSPALSFKHYESSEFGQKSVFSLFYPCLVGTPLTGSGSEGKILYILKKLGCRIATSEDTGFTEGQAVWEDMDGNLHAIDGSEGDVMIVNIEPYYRIIGKHTIDGTEYDVFLMSPKPFTWQGIDAEKVDKFGWSPDYCVSHTDTDNVVRMHSVYNPAWNGSYQAPDSIVGKFIYSQDEETGDITEEYDATATVLGGAGGLHTTDIDLPTGEQRAMNMNPDTTKTVPWMNATAAGAENLMALMLAEGGTFDAHNATLMGSGFSSNDAATAAADWEESGSGAKNGVRLVDKNNALKYYSLGTNAKSWTGKSGDFQLAKMINDWRNPFHVMEAHRAVCYAIQKGVHELEWFVFEGNKYKWRSVTGFAGPAQGEMTCVLWKMLSSKCASNVLDPTDKTTSIEGNRIDFLISVALFHGMTTQVSPSWWTSGLIFTEDENGQYEAYMERDQSKLVKSVAADNYNPATPRDFETAYKHVGTFAKGEGYRKNYSNDAFMLPDSNANKSGAGLHTYVGAYNWFTGTNTNAGKKSVRGFLRGGRAFGAYLSPLAMSGGSAPSSANTYIVFGICVRIED